VERKGFSPVSLDQLNDDSSNSAQRFAQRLEHAGYNHTHARKHLHARRGDSGSLIQPVRRIIRISELGGHVGKGGQQLRCDSLPETLLDALQLAQLVLKRESICYKILPNRNPQLVGFFLELSNPI